MLTVKANNGELKEIMRFQKLARADLKNNLSKKKMKALIPQAVRATYIGGLLVLCAGSIVVSGSSFDAEEFLSFLTALALVVEPIQVNRTFTFISFLLCMLLSHVFSLYEKLHTFFERKRSYTLTLPILKQNG
jgi:hypothetical protein